MSGGAKPTGVSTTPLSGLPRLKGANVDLAGYRAATKTELFAALDSIPAETEAGSSSCALVLDTALSGPFGLVAPLREFKDHGVDKIYHLIPGLLSTECHSVAYFIRPQVALAKRVATQVKTLEQKARSGGETPHVYMLFFVPRRSVLCEKVLVDEGVHSLLAVREYAMQLLVLEDDVLSMEQYAVAVLSRLAL